MTDLEQGGPASGNSKNLGDSGYSNGHHHCDCLHRSHSTGSGIVGPSGAELNPQPHKVNFRQFANPAPLGLCGFALTTFLLSLINIRTRSITVPNLVVGSAFAYGGLVQLLAGMWEMAVGNTFGATALSSYGGFWIAFAIIFTPGGFDIESAYLATGEGGARMFQETFGLFLFGWFIFTFLMCLCTVKSTVAFFLTFFTLTWAFLCLAIGFLVDNGKCIKAGGWFGLICSFLAWYCAFAGIQTPENSFFQFPIILFPWSAKPANTKSDTKSQ